MNVPLTSTPPIPTLADLGTDLLRISPLQRVLAIIIPFACIGAYIAFAFARLWPLAVVTLIYLSFVTYGSISHDLVHRTLGLPRRVNELLLTIIELLAFRSGHAYRLAHLHHHARFPHDDDIEGAAARMSLGRALVEGVIFQPRIMIWAAMRPGRTRGLVILEIVLVLCLLAGCAATIPLTPVFGVYAALMIAGSWIIPLVTSYVPHDPTGASALWQTRRFRGTVASIIALEHLYPWQRCCFWPVSRSG
jgi:beta-carotene hydroxylase